MMREPVQALLFDLDGTLIDSMPQHERAWARWREEQGVALDDEHFFEKTAGRSNDEILRDLLPGRTSADYLALGDGKERLYRELASESLELVAGARSFVQQARAAGLKLAVCTASTPENMALAFARFGIDGWVDAIVSPADGLRGKPHPDIFIDAARRLGVAPAQCIVFEDAPLGIEGARRAGMSAVALTTTLPAASFAGFDNVIAVAADFNGLALDAVLHTRPRSPRQEHHA